MLTYDAFFTPTLRLWRRTTAACAAVLIVLTAWLLVTRFERVRVVRVPGQSVTTTTEGST